jgi:diaminohydroxyphosphoribosylaminopyrimidine deaminase/5-amino-6-(5-phosphoribosylamino)uracil reductase
VSIERALELADAAAGRGYPNPTVGAVVVGPDGAVLGEGATEKWGGRHGEIVALEAAGRRTRGATLYVTMEPCAHHGLTPPCVDRIVTAGVGRVVAGCLDPNPQAGGGLEQLRASGVETELLDLPRARRQNEAWRTWIARRRPHVILKLAVSVDGRATVPGRRWVTGAESRRRVHELRASVDAVGVGMGTVRVDAPRLDARDVAVVRQPRRLAFGRGPLPAGSELELRDGMLVDELASLAGEGVQSLLLEGGPTLAGAFLADGLVDRLLVFVAPVLAGGGVPMLAELKRPIDLGAPEVEKVGDDVLLSWRLHEAWEEGRG